MVAVQVQKSVSYATREQLIEYLPPHYDLLLHWVKGAVNVKLCGEAENPGILFYVETPDPSDNRPLLAEELHDLECWVNGSHFWIRVEIERV